MTEGHRAGIMSALFLEAFTILCHAWAHRRERAVSQEAPGHHQELGEEAMTPLTPARRAFLRRVLSEDFADLRTPDMTALARALAPKRKPSWRDTVGCSLWNVRDWLEGPFDWPLAATMREVAAALDR